MVLKTKRDRDGNITKRKARWVVKGFKQRYRKDYEQTFTGVCKSVTWKLAIALAALFDLEIEQIDAVRAFLNSEADTDIYVKLPLNQKDDQGKPMTNTVCKLLKALYSLKQAPRLWQKKLSNALKELGFKPYTSDQCVYINQKTGILIITYVDDMLVLGKNAGKIKELKRAIVLR